MRGTRVLATLGPIAVSGALVAIAGLVPVQYPSERPVVSVTPVLGVTCPFTGSGGQLVVAGQEPRVRALSGKAVDASAPVTSPLAISLTGSRTPAAGIASTQGGALLWTECGTPTSSGSILIPNPATAEVVLANSDRLDALVNITLSGPDGPVRAAGLVDIQVPAGQVVKVPMSVHAPADTPLEVFWTASQGRVQASGQQIGEGREQAPSTQPDEVLAFAAVLGGQQRTRLVLHNPGPERAEVSISALGERGRFTPETDLASLEPGTTVVHDLTQPLAGQHTGLLVESTAPVTGLVEVQTGTDVGWVTPTRPGTRLGDVVPRGTLQLVNPNAVPARVVVRQAGAETAVTIPAGGVQRVPVQAGEVSVTSNMAIAAGAQMAGTGIGLTRLRALPAAEKAQSGTLDPHLGQE